LPVLPGRLPSLREAPKIGRDTILVEPILQ